MSNDSEQLKPITKRRRDLEERTLQIRNHLINGMNEQQIQHMLDISKPTFDRYIARIREEDIAILENRKEKNMVSDIILYKNRLNKALIDLNLLYNDPSATVKEKTDIIKTKCLIADQLIRIDKEGTALMKLDPELQGLIDNAASMTRNKIEITQYVKNDIQNNNYNTKPKSMENIKLDDYDIVV